MIGRGLPLWLPNGAILRDEIERYAREMEFLHGYHRVATPHITKEELFYRSGHLPYYAEDMYPPIDIKEESREEKYYLKPMNCPMHHLAYGARKHSYRELPMRLAEYGTVYRYEKSGQLSGLSRVRMLSMNDAHIYLSEAQVGDEIARLLDLYDTVYKTFGFDDYVVRLSVHDPKNKEKFFEGPELWKHAETALAAALDAKNINYVRGVGEAAFYGPKIDIQFRNVLGKEETVSTIQLDYLAAKKFDLKYTGDDGKEHDCVVIHRAPLSTHERFISYLLERFGGAFPTWLAPVQVRIIPIVDESIAFAREIKDRLHKDLVRIEVDESSDSLGK
jgi:threonyl-tRNA synthetase